MHAKIINFHYLSFLVLGSLIFYYGVTDNMYLNFFNQKNRQIKCWYTYLSMVVDNHSMSNSWSYKHMFYCAWLALSPLHLDLYQTCSLSSSITKTSKPLIKMQELSPINSHFSNNKIWLNIQNVNLTGE